MRDNKKIIFIGLGIIVLITIIVCFIIALNRVKNTDSIKSSNNGAKIIASKYKDIDYDTSTNLEDTTITSGGSYILKGEYSCITINTTKDVQLKLDDATITCDSGPAIYVENAETININVSGENKIDVKTTSDLDGAIYSKDDLILSGDGKLTIESNYDGIVSKDTIVINSGSYIINAEDDGIRGKDNVAIVDGEITINAKSNGIKSTNEEDPTKGYIAIDGGAININSALDAIDAKTEIVIKGGTFSLTTTSTASNTSAKGLKAKKLVEINGSTITIDAADDGIHSDSNIKISDGVISITTKDDAIHADGLVEIDNGTISLKGPEGIEATSVVINDGTIVIDATDDGINAGHKSNTYKTTVEINGGTITIDMGPGDTDGIDSNGNLYINGGTITINAQSPFDYDGEAKYSGGKMIINGEKTTTITNQIAGGPRGDRRR